MNTRDFKCFQIVYEEKNITTAANKLFMTPQGLGKVIQKLESECQATFFIRTQAGLVPTESGRVFYEHLSDITRDMNMMLLHVARVEKTGKRLRVGFAAGVFRALSLSKLASFVDENPDIVSEWCEYENAAVSKKVLNGELGYGLIIGDNTDKNLSAKLLGSVHIVAYVYRGHPFFERSCIGVEDLKDEPLISMNEKYHIFHDICTTCHSHGFEPRFAARVMEGEALRLLVNQKIGIGICPAFFKETEDLRPVPLEGDFTWDVYGIHRAEGADGSLIRKTEDYLMTCFPTQA